jgi:hypothetical protein
LNVPDSLLEGALLVPQEHEDALAPIRPTLRVQDIHESRTKNAGEKDARQCGYPAGGSIVGPNPLLEATLHPPNEWSHRVRNLGRSGSDLAGSVTILAPQRLHASPPILTL